MRLRAKSTLVTGLCGFAICLGSAQDEDYRHTQAQLETVNTQTPQENDRTLSADDRLSIIAAALDRRVRHSQRDCSHLVHAVYEEAGFPYSYRPSSEIYAGAAGFERVKQPESGDLVVWRGHVGIVIKPSRHIFFSYLSTGPGTDDYQAPYWRTRGHLRFYRYLKNSCTGCDSRGRQLLKVKR
jgi:NlpC/P60 family